MRLKDYGRKHQKRKLYVQQTDLLLVGIDVSKAKRDTCFGQTNQTISFENNREGFQRFEQTLRENVAVKKRVGQIRNQLRGALHLTFPELSNVLKDITQPTALRFFAKQPNTGIDYDQWPETFFGKMETSQKKRAMATS